MFFEMGHLNWILDQKKLCGHLLNQSFDRIAFRATIYVRFGIPPPTIESDQHIDQVLNIRLMKQTLEIQVPAPI
jgi:hypothetical protein